MGAAFLESAPCRPGARDRNTASLGVVAGYQGGWVATILTRAMDALMNAPEPLAPGLLRMSVPAAIVFGLIIIPTS